MCKLSVSEKIKRGKEFIGEYRSEPGFLAAVAELEENTSRIMIPLRGIEFLGIDERTDDFTETQEEIFDCEGFAIKIGDDIYNCRANAIKNMCERLGISGPTLAKFSKSELAQILKFCSEKFTNEDSATLVKIGDRAAAVLSDHYKVVKADEIYKEASRAIKKLGGEFLGGYLTVDDFLVAYTLKNQGISKVYQEKLEDDDFFKDAVPVVQVATSNTGFSSVSIIPQFKVKNRLITIGRSMKEAHKGNTDIDKVKENLNQIFSIFKEAIEGLEKLKNIKIDNPEFCFKNVAKRVLLPKKYTMLAAADFEGTVEYLNDIGKAVTAYDIYIGLTETIFHAENDGRPKEFINNLTELVSRSLFVDYKRYDTPYSDWD